MSVPCTKELLLSLIEDIELIARELIENSVAPKQSRMPAHEHKAVTELLVAKDKELKETLKLAAEQGGVEKEIEMVRVENDFIIEKHGSAYWPPPIWWPIRAVMNNLFRNDSEDDCCKVCSPSLIHSRIQDQPKAWQEYRLCPT